MKSDLRNNILPVGPLMIEHRLIERMVALIEQESAKIREKGQVNIELANAAADFFKVYADLCHHGKEEDILFKELQVKPLSAGDKAMLEELKSDHVRARGLVGKLAASAKDIRSQQTKVKAGLIAEIMEDLSKLYRAHIRKEDKQFFIPVMKYFTKNEQDEMLSKFREFDMTLIHERYKSAVLQYEQGFRI
ncbi:MAG: hemerythrin domain-containing protein [Candidatus Omnitrophica bacterium]|nr:hemerythrin domain-containing protein [Candidatus Omnitrophota bacterium]